MKTSEFAVKPRVKMVFKILPLVAIGATAYVLWPEPEPEPLESPVGPPENKE